MKNLHSIASSFVVLALIASFIACTTDATALCFRTGTFNACSQTPAYVQGLRCTNPEGDIWSCSSAAPTKNEKVQRCANVSPGEHGKKVCMTGTATKKCTYKKAKCGLTMGECSFETKKTHSVKSQSATGGDCSAPNNTGGGQKL